MAVLAIGLAGAALGAAFIPTITIGALAITGATIGFTAGTIAGQLLFGGVGGTIEQEGPRLGDLRVMTSAYGAPIPRIWGTTRIATSVIWSSSIKETKHEENTEVGGKGGGGTEVTMTTYTYSIDLAVAICEGPIKGVIKIWMNGSLMYNLSAGASIGTTIRTGSSAASVRVYPGDETQTADPLIESYVGAANAPAHRGIAYIVFDDLQLADFGNRIPNIEVEVIVADTLTWSGTEYAVANFSQDIQGGNEGGDGNLGFVQSRIRSDGSMLLYAWNTYSSVLKTDETPWGYTFYSGDTFTYTVYLFVNGTYAGKKRQFLLVDPNLIEQAGADSGSSDYKFNVFEASSVFADDASLFCIQGITGRCCPFILRFNPASKLKLALRNGQTVFLHEEQSLISISTGVSFAPGISPRVITKFAEHVYFHYETDVGQTEWRTDYHNLESGETIALEINGDRYQDGFNTQGRFNSDVDGWYDTQHTGGTLKIREYAHGAKVALATYDTGRTATSPGIFGIWRIEDGSAFIIMFNSFSPIYKYDKVSDSFFSLGSVTTQPGRAIAWGYGAAAYTPGSLGSVVVKMATFGQSPSGSTALSTVVSDISQSSGLDATDIDVTNLTQSVRGFVIPRPMAVRRALEPLQRSFFFDAVESDFKLKYVPRGGSSVATITAGELAARQEGEELPDQDTITRRQELELARKIRVLYINPNTHYQQGEQYAARLITSAVNELTAELPIVLVDNEARQIADVLLFNDWAERERHKVQMGVEYSYLDPTDIITVNTDNATHELRIIQSDFRIPGLVTFDCAPEDVSVYTSNNIGGSATPADDTLELRGSTGFEPLDIPLLRSTDNNAGFYVSVTGYTTSWNGAVLMSSLNGTNYVQILNLLSASIIGRVSTLIASGPSTIWDNGNTFTVDNFPGDVPTSSTELEVLAGDNHAAVGINGRYEIIGFVNVVDNSDDTYTLSKLLRGRGGTDHNVGNHQIDDNFIMLTTALRRVTSDLDEIDVEKTYKAVTIGMKPQDAAEEFFTNTGVGLKPYSPVNVKGSRDGSNNLTIVWNRRTRFGGEWRDFVDVPLNEQSESYEVDVMSGTTVLRTITATTETASYTAAEQTTDGLTPGDPVEVNVYQISAEIGRGYTRNATI